MMQNKAVVSFGVVFWLPEHQSHPSSLLFWIAIFVAHKHTSLDVLVFI